MSAIAEVSFWYIAYASAQCGWNAMPVDMADAQRYITSIVREFRFPFDHSLEEKSPYGIPEEGQGVVEFVQDLKRFMSDQQQILALLNNESRALHRVGHNAIVKIHLFQYGGIVLCHRQVQSQKSKQI
jgi:hypothetical protein